jgi:FlaA1/EpsC-like NDP-sugar epimerase
MRVIISRNLYIILVIDIFLLCLSFYLAHLIRFDFQIPDHLLENLLGLMIWVVAIKLICFYRFNLYRGMWRYTGLNDLFNVVKAMTVGGLVAISFVLYLNRFEGVSRSVFIIDWCLGIIFIASLRICTRLAFEQFTQEVSFQDLIGAVARIFKKKIRNTKGVLIIGAGDCGEKICREIREDASLKYHVEGFLDDDPAKIGRQIHGVPVLDRIEGVERTAIATKADEIIIAIPSLGTGRIRQIVEYCKKAEISFKTVPSMGELINGKVTINSVREVEYRDLLGRKPVQLDRDRIGQYLTGTCVMVTGAGGSIGQGLCRQVCRYSPQTLVLLERAESPLFEIDLELKREFAHIEIIPMLADIQDMGELEKIFERWRPAIVFHAAAYKHVPMLEAHPWKAIDNNIVGTENMVRVAQQFNCDKFVFVSTDKAVNPANVMGTSKRIAELIVQNYPSQTSLSQSSSQSSKTSFITVRFGNVIGSVGSVIPLFKKQIKEGGPVTVTHPDMVRYFMLIPEACQLILQAGAMGKGGEIFVLEMGKPVRIDDMARDLIRFSGFEPDQDIHIEYTGLRPGEKLYEELITADENVVPTDHQKIMVLNGNKIDMTAVYGFIEELKAISIYRDRDQIVGLLKQVVPEYTP